MASFIETDVRNLICSEHLDFFSNKKILVTGASGLLGNYFRAFFNLIQREDGTDIEVHYQTKTGIFIEPNQPKKNVIVADLSEVTSDFYKALPNFDIIIHAATYGQPSKFLSEKLQTISLNSGVMLNLAGKLQEKGVFLFLSSSEVYSGLNRAPFLESEIGTTDPSHPRAAYIESKRLGETIMNSLALDFSGIRAHSARLALAYGPGFRETDRRVLNELIMQAVVSKEIKLKDSGQARRTYCYITDVLEMLIGILVKGQHQVYNVGGTSRTTIVNLAKAISNLTGSQLVVPQVIDVSDSGAPQEVWIDLDRIQSLLAKESFVGLEDGLNRTISWYRQFKSQINKDGDVVRK